jgi:hypothetical protein
MLFNRRRLVSPEISAYIRASTNTYLEKYLKNDLKTIPKINGSDVSELVPYNKKCYNLLVFPIALCLFCFLQKRGK